VYRFSADLDFHGDVIVSRYLNSLDTAALQNKFLQTANAKHPGDTRAFEIVLKEQGARIVQAVGAEVDRMERGIQELVPEVKYVDLEADRGRFWLYRASIDGDPSARGPFDMSQLSMDAVAWARESDRIDSLLAQGRSGGQQSGLPALAERSMADHASDITGSSSSSSSADSQDDEGAPGPRPPRRRGMVLDLSAGKTVSVRPGAKRKPMQSNDAGVNGASKANGAGSRSGEELQAEATKLRQREGSSAGGKQ
jgi:hypothetical protein